jgi:hypothetical protein
LAVKHNTRAHASLSASSSARWLNCPPSALLNAAVPDVTTDYAREGTCAHELAEYKVNRLLGGKKKFDEILGELTYKPQGMEPRK